MDIFLQIRYLSRNVYGREFAWAYYRLNYQQLVDTFGLDDIRLGEALIEITASFETHELLSQVIISSFWGLLNL